MHVKFGTRILTYYWQSHWPRHQFKAGFGGVCRELVYKIMVKVTAL